MPEGFRTDGCGPPPGTWSNLEAAPPLTLEGLREGIRFYEEARASQPMVDRWCQVFSAQNGDPCRCSLCEPLTGADNATDELMALVRQGDEAGFRELAACVMPADEVEECWAGARARLGLASSPRQPEPPFRGVPAYPVLP